jgi:2-dehydro-3-deoxyglucarate aldolase/4-hydroxy-2-oxoheptanedioate aldolase
VFNVTREVSENGTALKARSRAYGTMVFEFFTPGIAQICASAGADFILFDMEHSAVSFDVIRQQIAFCRGLPITPIVRIPTTEYHFIARALDAGAKGIIVPMVESAEQAAEIVQFAKYPPLGRRGAAFGIAHDDFKAGDIPAKIAAANNEILVASQIETERGLEAVDEIAATPGIDTLWLGQFDMTNFLGIPGNFEDQKYLEAVDLIVAAGARHGKSLGLMAGDENWAREYHAKGFNLIAFGLDHQLFQRALGDGLRLLNSLDRVQPKPCPDPVTAELNGT